MHKRRRVALLQWGAAHGRGHRRWRRLMWRVWLRRVWLRRVWLRRVWLRRVWLRRVCLRRVCLRRVCLRRVCLRRVWLCKVSLRWEHLRCQPTHQSRWWDAGHGLGNAIPHRRCRRIGLRRHSGLRCCGVLGSRGERRRGRLCGLRAECRWLL